MIFNANMQDGGLICTGLGNKKWYLNTLHGMGRIMSRKGTFNSFSLNSFEKSMKGR